MDKFTTPEKLFKYPTSSEGKAGFLRPSTVVTPLASPVLPFKLPSFAPRPSLWAPACALGPSALTGKADPPTVDGDDSRSAVPCSTFAYPCSMEELPRPLEKPCSADSDDSCSASEPQEDSRPTPRRFPRCSRGGRGHAREEAIDLPSQQWIQDHEACLSPQRVVQAQSWIYTDDPELMSPLRIAPYPTTLAVLPPLVREGGSDAAENAAVYVDVPLAVEDTPLEKFRRYCATLRRLEAPQVTVDIELRQGFCRVKKLVSRKTMPSMWSPLWRWTLPCCRPARQWCDVLTDLNAVFPSGKMTLLLGAPGSGKTTLLKLLAGKLHGEGHWSSGGLLYNGEHAEAFPLHPGLCFSFVPESDAHHIPEMTVRDTLKFAYECKSRYNVEGTSHVDTLLEVLGLSHVKDTIVGSDLVRGVSGGERRRVTIGEMWVSNVKVLLADHLTDGLDSATTCDIIKALKIWCTTLKTTVVMTLQQPPPEVYRCFENVCVLERGTIAFTGSLVDASDYLRRLGHDRPCEGEPPSPSPRQTVTRTP
eukprot:RCo016040